LLLAEGISDIESFESRTMNAYERRQDVQMEGTVKALRKQEVAKKFQRVKFCESYSVE
jgi:hypothetical protein